MLQKALGAVGSLGVGAEHLYVINDLYTGTVSPHRINPIIFVFFKVVSESHSQMKVMITKNIHLVIFYLENGPL